jgi:TolB-like protein
MSTSPDIFLSYSRDDQATARKFAEALERNGFSVWWDQSLRSGEAYDQVTEDALKAARAVVLLWSKKSVASRWVRAEATLADRNKTLMPVMIEPCERPIMFELTHTADLCHWKGDANDTVWQNFISDIKRFVQSDHVAPALAQPVLASSRLRNRLLSVDLLIAAVVIVAIALTVLWRQSGPADTNSSAPTSAAATASVATTTKSIAVLPFANLSSDADQAYFADGISDEMISKLSQVKGLQVTGRNSSFYFKGRNSTLAEISKLLGVGHVLQGSVQKSGTHLRINAQLMDTNTGGNVWSQSYDKELADIFAIQDEIAKAVTTALSITLGVGEFDRVGMTHNVEAYNLYLKAKAISAADGVTAYAKAVDYSQQALALDPGFGLGWIALGNAAFNGIVNLPPEQVRDYPALIDKARLQAKAVAPNLMESLLADAEFSVHNGHWLEADRLLQQALAQNETNSAAANLSYGGFLSSAGRSREALPYLQRAARLDPLSSDIARSLSAVLLNLDRLEDAIHEADRGIALGNAADNVYLRATKMIAAYSKGDLSLGAKEVHAGGAPPGAVFGEIADLLTAHKNAETLALIRQTLANDVSPVTYSALSLPAMLAGDRQLALDLTLKPINANRMSAASHLHFWISLTNPLRQLPAFKTAVKDGGLVDYWRTTGKWADKCHPVGDDFECE